VQGPGCCVVLVLFCNRPTRKGLQAGSAEVGQARICRPRTRMDDREAEAAGDDGQNKRAKSNATCSLTAGASNTAREIWREGDCEAPADRPSGGRRQLPIPDKHTTGPADREWRTYTSSCTFSGLNISAAR
jgi:hypothetical protein